MASGTTSAPAAVSASSLAAGNRSNVLPISVGPAGKVNLPMASVTVCVPGSATCQTIDRIIVDTGSTGLRLAASALMLALPQQTGANGSLIAECAQFADGYTWGGVHAADVTIAGETAASLTMQVIAAGVPAAPAACASTGRAMDLVRDLGANGILGLNAFRRDCGPACEQSADMGIYYACVGSTCRGDTRSLARQVANPVPLFAANNNGLIVRLPAVPASGASRVDGTLVFGIGTSDNNALGSASVYALSMLTGTLLTYYKGEAYDHSFLDTGSNALFFRDAAIPLCRSGSGFFCSPTPQSLVATIQGHNGANANISFTVDDADALIAAGASALNNVGAPTFSALTFDWGLPFFFGRSVYVAIEGSGVPGAAAGPFVAF